jgi:hypothetical protein
MSWLRRLRRGARGFSYSMTSRLIATALKPAASFADNEQGHPQGTPTNATLNGATELISNLRTVGVPTWRREVPTWRR